MIVGRVLKTLPDPILAVVAALRAADDRAILDRTGIGSVRKRSLSTRGCRKRAEHMPITHSDFGSGPKPRMGAKTCTEPTTTRTSSQKCSLKKSN